ncbi:FtsX-like permease family protein [Neolewinella lacunae]|uniref:ABC transporter permease n=1 Tax=Neolewinella lacunae TaxID=1517758 RepID=A0A923T6V8_9BACT|nr:FtsX-like permease family protein [Neolewinella lacunae]MBC6992919.1 ABC transporter permease [Neolewinella lacunae]MDN3633717.1 FtsX-like permease family protein [Neolewinella lacunae]
MNLPLYLARGVAKGGTKSVSRTIIGIAVAAVAISMATMVLASALIAGFKSEISTKIFGFWGHIHITADAASYGIFDTYNYPISNRQDFYPSLDTTGRVSLQGFGASLGLEAGAPQMTRAGIRHIQQFIVLPGVVSVYPEGERLPTQEALVLKGIAEDYDWDNFGRYLVEGEALRVSPDSTSRGIIISSITATRLEIGLGDRMDFAFIGPRGEERARAFQVTGIYKTGLEEFDRQFALVDLKQPRSLLNWEEDQIGGFEVILDDIADLEIFNDYIHYQVLPQDLYGESIRRKVSELFNWLDIQDYNWAIILALMITVAIINMMTALLILILERTNMIGTLKSLGLSNWGIRKIFLYYAGFIIISGLALGNGIGLLLCWVQKTFGLVHLDEESYYLSVAPIQIDWSTLLALNVGTFLLTLFFLVVPSYLVTRIDPVKALRFK